MRINWRPSFKSYVPIILPYLRFIRAVTSVLWLLRAITSLHENEQKIYYAVISYVLCNVKKTLLKARTLSNLLNIRSIAKYQEEKLNKFLAVILLSKFGPNLLHV